MLFKYVHNNMVGKELRTTQIMLFKYDALVVIMNGAKKIYPNK